MVSIRLHEQGRKGALQGRADSSDALFPNLHIVMTLLFICSRHKHEITMLIALHISFAWSQASFAQFLISIMFHITVARSGFA
jgi:hypothetical protein